MKSFAYIASEKEFYMRMHLSHITDIISNELYKSNGTTTSNDNETNSPVSKATSSVNDTLTFLITP